MDDADKSSGKRVAILLPDLRGGGAERVSVELANAFSARGYAVDMVLMRAEGVLLSELDCACEVVSLRVDRLRSVLGPLRRYMRSRRPSSLIANMWPLTSVAIWARELARVPTRVVVCDHNDYAAAPAGITAPGRLKLKASMWVSYPRADCIVAVSNGVADSVARFSRVSRDRISVINNPVAGPRLAEMDAPCDAAPGWAAHEGPRLIAIGSFKPQKDFPLLLSAFARLRGKADARLLILGEGALRGALEARLLELSLERRVDMPGFVPRPWPYLARADLLVLSSAWEGMANVIVEALACGTPVIATDCRSGPREILDDGRYGRLVPVGDAEALAAAMLKSLNEPRDGERLRRRAADFSVEKATAAYLKLLFPESIHSVSDQ